MTNVTSFAKSKTNHERLETSANTRVN